MEHEATIRLLVFFGVFGLLAFWELLAPRRALTMRKSNRWLTNWGLSLTNTAVAAGMKILLGAAAVAAALDAQDLGWGLFHQIAWPLWLEVIIAF
ncbi:MAG: sterol desaturase family protein, partial [Pseudomonadota bacterium]